MAPIDFLLVGGSVGVAGTLVALAAVTYAVYDAVEVIPAYERRALVVSGEYREMLEPGIAVVPPFVSKTYPIEMRTQELTLPVDARTRDDEQIRVESHVRFQVVDPEAAFRAVDDYRRHLLERVDAVLREEAGSHWCEDLLDDAGALEDALAQALSAAREWGLSIEEVRVEIVDPADEDEVAA